jgi:NADP-dependent 3-hydroxy acid dehydrogenase YdfG
VAVNYTSNSLAADEVVRQIRAAGGQAITVRADVANEAQVVAMFEKVDAKFGRLTALVNNAGVVDVNSRVDGITLARLQRMFEINVFGSFLCAREAVRRMSTRYGGAGGAIVNVSSAAARLGSPGSYVDYAAAKGAIDTFTLGVAQFKAHWDSVKTKLLPMIFTKLDNYKLQIEEAKLNDSELWPIGKNFDTEYQRLQNWLTDRLSVMDANIQKYSATSSGGRGN